MSPSLSIQPNTLLPLVGNEDAFTPPPCTADLYASSVTTHTGPVTDAMFTRSMHTNFVYTKCAKSNPLGKMSLTLLLNQKNGSRSLLDKIQFKV